METPVSLSHPAYHDEEAARLFLEGLRWPNGARCAYCGTDEVKVLGGKSMGPGWYHCPRCRRRFTVRVGSIFERSHIPLHKWMMGFRLMAASKKGMSAHQMHRMIGITYKSAWFMEHRIREAMKETDTSPLGGEGKIVETDETFTGGDAAKFVNGKGWRTSRGRRPGVTVMTLVERGGRARSVKVNDLTADTVRHTLAENLDAKSRLMTDEARHYMRVGKEYASHETVNHSKKEYARGDVTTNTVEGYFAVFKRGLFGTYQHMSEQHLARYLVEFDFRYSNRAALKINDAERMTRALKGAEGRRLMYRQPASKAAA